MRSVTTQERRKMDKSRRVGGPTHNVKQSAEYLEYSPDWIRKLANKSDDDPMRLPAFINLLDRGWIEHHANENVEKKDLMFYLCDLEDFRAKFPRPQESDRFSNVKVDPEERELIIALASEELEEKGYVTRTHLRDRMKRDYGKSDRIIDRIGKVALEQGWPVYKGSQGRTRKKRNPQA